MAITRYEDFMNTGLRRETLRALEQIAMKACWVLEKRGGIEERYSDAEDFLEITVMSIQGMLEEAYRLGVNDGKSVE